MPKLPREMLDKFFFSKESSDEDLVMGPEYGEDAAVFKRGEDYEVVHLDPISGAVDNIGWLSINIPANDISVTGAEPDWALTSIQVPEDFEEDDFRTTVEDIHEACEELDISLVGGHTETVEDLKKPLINTTVGGYTRSPVLTSGAEPGDLILQVDAAGIEGSWILVEDHEEKMIEKGLDKENLEKVRSWRKDISVVEQALALREFATSMHDPTEGGIIQGLYECAAASGNDFIVDEDILFREPTREICGILDLDPLRLISSGCLIATVSEDLESDRYLEGNVIGRVEEGEGSLIYDGERMESIQKDELFRALEMFK